MPKARRGAGSPGRLIVAGFAGAVVVGTLLLMMPFSRAGDSAASPVVALFTATSAVCVTGLAVTDPDYWSHAGEAVILVLVQLGGLGIMSATSLLVLFVSRRIGLRTRITTATESNQVGFGDLGRVLLNVVRISLALEVAVAAVLFPRFWLTYDEQPPEAAWSAAFHAIMAFNNAGFGLRDDSLVAFVADPWVCVPVMLAVIAGSLGFPVLFELLGHVVRPREWTLHTKMTLAGTGALLLLGPLVVTAVEWRNPATLGALDPGGRVLAGLFQGVMPRSAGFNTIDYGEMRESTLLATDALMFVGGGSAGTAGGIKVTTFLVLLAVILAEVRGDRDAGLFHRRLPPGTQRQAISLMLMSLLVVIASTFTLELLTGLPTGIALFEVTSAFTTTGLSTGATGEMPTSGRLLLTGLMFLGRLGPIAFASALALRERPQLYTYPEGRPIIG